MMELKLWNKWFNLDNGGIPCHRVSSEEPPTDEAKKTTLVMMESRDVDDPSKLPYKRDPLAWYNYGRNHRVENGKICRDYDEEHWTVLIPDADALGKFCEENGEIILSTVNSASGPIFSIEIYDSYRE